MQKRKNSILAIWLVILLAVTVAVFMYSPNGRDAAWKTVFNVGNSIQIDKVVLESVNGKNTLTLEGRRWELNGAHTADLERVNDLFAILSDAHVRRKVPEKEQVGLEKAFDERGIEVRFFNDADLVITYKVMGNKKGTVTYFMDVDKNIFIVHIPGQHYDIAKLFELDEKGWRTRYVFAANWTTLENMEISYSRFPSKNFSIKYSPTGYYVAGVANLDTVVMYDYLEQVSFLQVREFLDVPPTVNEHADFIIELYDVGNNSLQLAFYVGQDSNIYYGQLDNDEWVIFDYRDIRGLMQGNDHFEKQSGE